MPQFNRATMSMKSLGALVLENDFLGMRINKELDRIAKELNSGKLTEENIDIFCKYVRRLIQLLENIKIYARREQFIDENVLRQWGLHIKENNISVLGRGVKDTFSRVNRILFKLAAELNEQRRDERRLMKGRLPLNATLQNILLNDKFFYREIAKESVALGMESQKAHILRYAAQNALMKLRIQPSRENLEAFRTSLMQLFDYISEDLSKLFNIEKEDEILESHLVKEIDKYISICKSKNLDVLERKLISLKEDVIAYFRRDLKDASLMFKRTREFVTESLRQRREAEVKPVVEELIDLKSSYFHQAYALLESFGEGGIETKEWLRNALRYKLGGNYNSYPLVNHLIIERIGDKVNAALYGQYMVASNVALIGYFAGKTKNPFGMANQLRLAFRMDAKRHGKSDVWLFIAEAETDKLGRIKLSEKTKIQLIAMKRWGAIPLDFDYYQAEMGIDDWKTVKMILFAAYPYGKLDGLTQRDLIFILIPLYRAYGVTRTEEPYKMTMEGLKNKPFIGQKLGFDISRLAKFRERKNK